MKFSPLAFACALLLVLVSSLHADPAKPDPLLGNWLWHHKISVEFKDDGTATSDANSKGKWMFLNNAEAQRKYRVNWDQGKFVDTVILAEDGKTALLVTDSGKYNIRRKTE